MKLPVFSVASTNMFYIIIPFLYLSEKCRFYPTPLCVMVGPSFPLQYVPVIFDSCYISLLTFLLQEVGLGKFQILIQVTETIVYVTCIKGKYQEKYLQGIFSIHPPTLCYIFVKTIEMFILPVDQDSILIAQPILSLPLL